MFRMVVRRRWFLLGPACGIALLTAAILARIPNVYSSEATLVMQQQVLQRYVPSAGADADIVTAMTRQVLSRSQLLGVIREFDLYSGQKKKPDIVRVERMRKDIEILPLDPKPQSDFNAFKIAFSAADPKVAQAVTSRLTQLFIDANYRTRESQTASTSSFLSDQIESVRQKLAEQEQKIKDFKTQHSGEFGDQQIANITVVTDLRTQLQAARSSLSRARDRRASIEASVRSILAKLKEDRATLLVRFTPQHPDVVKKDGEIARAEAVLNSIGKGGRGTAPLPLDQPALADLASQAMSNDREIEELAGQEARLEAELRQYQGRLTLAPVREQQLTSISRDYELLRQQYAELVQRKQQSQMATNLEQNREGLQFRLVDPPTLPYLPSGPKRVKMAFAGLVAGIGLGLALAFLMETRDTSFHSHRQLRERYELPLVVSIPKLLTPIEERALKLRWTFEWAAGATMVVAVAIVEYLVCSQV
ncbi:MAG: hypothetical protein ACM336_02065 [Acidobacteriota bacterium]